MLKQGFTVFKGFVTNFNTNIIIWVILQWSNFLYIKENVLYKSGTSGNMWTHTQTQWYVWYLVVILHNKLLNILNIRRYTHDMQALV